LKELELEDQHVVSGVHLPPSVPVAMPVFASGITDESKASMPEPSVRRRDAGVTHATALHRMQPPSTACNRPRHAREPRRVALAA
jgi:hypothetical protein